MLSCLLIQVLALPAEQRVGGTAGHISLWACHCAENAERARLLPALAEMLGTEHSLSGKEEAGHLGGGSVTNLVTHCLELNFLSAPGVKENLSGFC